MTHQRIQDILNESSPGLSSKNLKPQPYMTDVFHLDQHYRIYTAEQLIGISSLSCPIEYEFFRTPKFRRWDGKKDYPDVDLALAGRLKSNLFCGYLLLRGGLILEFLNIHSQTLITKAYETIHQLNSTDDPEQARAIRQRCEHDLYEQHVRKVVVMGNFQVCFTEKDRENAVLIDSRRDSYLINVITDGHCVEAITLKRNKSQPSHHTIFS